MTDHIKLIERIQAYIDDPMWPSHAEVSKPLLSKVVAALQRQAEETAIHHKNIERLDSIIHEQAAEIEALRADAERWQALYRRAINEANGLTNYVEERPELTCAERRIAKIEADACAAMRGVKG